MRSRHFTLRNAIASTRTLVALLTCGIIGILSASFPTVHAREDNEVTREKVLAFLKHYSRTGYLLVNTDETMRRDHPDYRNDFMRFYNRISIWEIGHQKRGITLTATHRIALRTTTGIHEMCHMLTRPSCLSRKKDPDVIASCTDYCADENSICLWPGRGEPLAVKFTATFPSKEIADDYPANLFKTERDGQFRFGLYISPSLDTHVTQLYGVYGLLEEFNAYLVGARAAFEIWPWYCANAGSDSNIWQDYFTALGADLFAYHQFRIYIYLYLKYAKLHKAQIYRGIMENASFRRAFRAVDQEWLKLMSDYRQREKALKTVLLSRGIDLVDNMKTWKGGGARPLVIGALSSDQYSVESEKELQKEEYGEILGELAKK